jgi:CheY-like chemotaxis protein
VVVAHILLIEDDDEVVAFARSLLHKGGFTVDVAGDGDRALAAYMTKRPDAILLDVFVPRLDGLRFARRIAERFPADRVPIVVWTGAADPDSMGDLIETPHVLAKPVGGDELMEVLRRALHQRTRRSAPVVLLAGRRAATLRSLVRELRDQLDVQTALAPDEALRLMRELRPQAVLVDLGGDEREGGELLRDLQARFPKVPRLALVSDAQAPYAESLVASGAATGLHRTAAPRALLRDRLRAIMR